MSSTPQKFYLDQDFGTEKVETEKDSQDVINILDLFKMLSVEDKITTIRKLRQEKLFN